MFVTTNLITLAAFMTYTKVNTLARENSMATVPEDQLVGSHDQESTNSDRVQFQGDSSPLKKYSECEIILEKSQTSTTYNSQHAKMSLFHLFYSFYLYQGVLNNVAADNKSDWSRELALLAKEKTSDVNSVPLRYFYDTWKIEFQEIFSKLNKSQQFHLPNWTEYPAAFKFLCHWLYDNDMHTIGNFFSLYYKVKPTSQRRLLEMWFYDHSHLFSVEADTDNEIFYNKVIKNCVHDTSLFNKYASVVLDPQNPRRRVFFNKHLLKGSKTVSLDTILELLRGIIDSKKNSKNSLYHDSVIKLISMLRKDCVMTRGINGPKVRILLMDKLDDELDTNATVSQRERTKCYKLVSENPEAMAILDDIAKWKSK